MPKPEATSQYDPFGMLLSGRSWEAGNDYRFGFNGKEGDPELYGNGNIYDYGFRIYNPRLGKFLSVDPLTSGYAWYSPYQYAGNKPIWCKDLDGLEDGISTGMMVNNWEAQDRAFDNGNITFDELVEKRTRSQMAVGMGGSAGTLIVMAGQGGRTVFWWAVRNPYTATAVGNFAMGLADPNPVGNWDTPGPIDDAGRATRQVVVKNLAGKTVGNWSSSKMLNVTASNAKLWGGNSVGLVANKTTTILGKTNDIDFIRAYGVHREGANTGSLNILCRNNEWNQIAGKYGDPDNLDLIGLQKARMEFFNSYNKPWLQAAIDRGDNFRLVSDPTSPKAIFANSVDETGGLTTFGMEVEHLEKAGYTFLNGSAVKQ